VRAVNLLPEKHRPRRATGGKSGSSYVLLGVLGAVVVAVLMYVLTLNSINSAKTEIVDAKAAAQRANAQAQSLGAYGDFAKVKQERVDAVKQLAEGRVDWERLVRELAHVLPAGVWISNASAADSPGNEQSSSGSSSSSSTSGSASSSTSTSTTSTSGGSSDSSAAGGGPVLTLEGCARDQAAVAETLVRLREMQGASDVKLDHSTQPDDQGSGTQSSDTECGATHKVANYVFQIDVSFEAPKPEPYKPGRVPTRLGGGQ
jgi:Tfp pilus assembly protein PilN